MNVNATASLVTRPGIDSGRRRVEATAADKPVSQRDNHANALQQPSLVAKNNKVNSDNKPASAETGGEKSVLSETSRAERQKLDQLKKLDGEVRSHEKSHLAAAAGLASSGAQYGYAIGPDGQRYAVSGEVKIENSKGSSAQESLLQAQQIQAAALAPAKPSSQDRAVAANAARAEVQAREEIAQEAEQASAENNKTAVEPEKEIGVAQQSTNEKAVSSSEQEYQRIELNRQQRETVLAYQSTAGSAQERPQFLSVKV